MRTQKQKSSHSKGKIEPNFGQILNTWANRANVKWGSEMDETQNEVKSVRSATDAEVLLHNALPKQVALCYCV